MRTIIAGTILLALTACGSQETTAPSAAETSPGAAASAGPTQVAAAVPPPAPSNAQPASFATCKSCHAVQPDKHGIGPSLHGVHGAKAGSAAGFAYSEANRTSGKTWDDASLDAYLAAPMQAMPGTKMSYAGMKDPAKRAEVIAYMKSLK